MNEISWKIEEVKQDIIKEKIKKYDGEVEKGQYLGATFPKHQIIYLDKDTDLDQKKQTLTHELMHAYITSYLFDLHDISIEDLCNISACSHNIIHKIVEKYFKDRK